MPDCVFCKIVKERVTDERSVISFEPLNPVTPGHRLFVPVEHVEDAGTSPSITSIVMEQAAWWAKEEGDDFNLITSAGTDATQTVLHLHIHYVPRRADDGLHLPWTGQVKA